MATKVLLLPFRFAWLLLVWIRLRCRPPKRVREKMFVHYDCRYFLGHKPCIFRRPCDGCPHYRPSGTRILIIKLAAMGDVLRTTPLLRGLKRAHPDSHITWLTEPKVIPMLKGIPEIDRLLAYDPESVLQLAVRAFDQLYCFDKEPKASALAMKIQAGWKTGFGLTEHGNVMPLSNGIRIHV